MHFYFLYSKFFLPIFECRIFIKNMETNSMCCFTKEVLNVKKIIMLCFLALMLSFGYCSDNNKVFANTNPQASYELHKTQNMWTFLKLNTRNGKIWQVHFEVNNPGTEGVHIVNGIPLCEPYEESKDRFVLYATSNMYNYMLLDSITGRTWQVQWSFQALNRFMYEIK